MRLKTVNLPDPLTQGLCDLIREGYYPNASEAIREAIRDLLKLHGKL